MSKLPPILCIVGPSGSGKTTLMEGLIRELSKRGYRVATIKHTHHAVEPDQSRKDSWRHRQAGATVSVLSSPRLVAAFSPVERELTLEELRDRFIQDVDLILVEGYKGSDYPKILIVGDGKCEAANWTRVKAVVADQELHPDFPIFKPADVTGIVSFLEYEFLGCPKESLPD